MGGLSGIRMHICPSINNGMCACARACVWKQYPILSTYHSPSARPAPGGCHPSACDLCFRQSLQQKVDLIITSCPSPGAAIIRLSFPLRTFLPLWRPTVFPFVSVSTSPAIMKHEEQPGLCFENLYRPGWNQVGLTATGEIVANSVRSLWISQLNLESLQRPSACGLSFYTNNLKTTVWQYLRFQKHGKNFKQDYQNSRSGCDLRRSGGEKKPIQITRWKRGML